MSKKILLIRFSSIGDIVLTTPIIRCVKQQIPGAAIHFLTKAVNKNILSGNPNIDKLHFLKESLQKTAKELKAEKFDVIIDLHNNIRSRIISYYCGVKTYRFNKINVAKWLKVNFKINMLPNKHIVDRYFDAIKNLNITNDNKGLDFFIEPQNNFEHPFINESYIAVAIGAKHFTKRIPPEKLIYIIKKTNYRFVLLGDKNDVLSANVISKQFPLKTLNLCGNINLQQSASVVQQSKTVITGDTALMHIAAAFNKPIFSIWGNTVPQFGMYPYLFKDEKQLSIEDLSIYQNDNLNCKPCSKIGYDKCPKKHFSCMLDIKYDMLVEDLRKIEC